MRWAGQAVGWGVLLVTPSGAAAEPKHPTPASDFSAWSQQNMPQTATGNASHGQDGPQLPSPSRFPVPRPTAPIQNGGWEVSTGLGAQVDAPSRPEVLHGNKDPANDVASPPAVPQEGDENAAVSSRLFGNDPNWRGWKSGYSYHGDHYWPRWSKGGWSWVGTGPTFVRRTPDGLAAYAWSLCPGANGFYPEIRHCARDWLQVPAEAAHASVVGSPSLDLMPADTNPPLPPTVSHGSSAIYSWTGKDGVLHFTNSYGSIPAQERGRVSTTPEKP